jgi:hypothetical protein
MKRPPGMTERPFLFGEPPEKRGAFSSGACYNLPIGFPLAISGKIDTPIYVPSY